MSDDGCLELLQNLHFVLQMVNLNIESNRLIYLDNVLTDKSCSILANLIPKFKKLRELSISSIAFR